MIESAPSPPPTPKFPRNPAENAPKQTQDLVLKSLDAQYPLLYIEPTPKQVLSAPGEVWRIQLVEKPA
jgi:hypothetical protein